MGKEDTADFVFMAREALALTQAELGAKIGRDRRAIIRYEQGEPLPPVVQLAIKQLLTEHGAAPAAQPQARGAKLAIKQLLTEHGAKRDVHLAVKQWLTEHKAKERKRKRAKRGKSHG